MSKKNKVAVFCISFWKDEKHPHYEEWRKRVDKNINYDYIFNCPGSYSDPKIMENEMEVVQIDLLNTKPYDRDWSYWRVGFLNAMYHLLLNVKDFDIAIHVQDSVLLNMDLNDTIREFRERDEIIASPRFLSEGGLMMETACMMLKKEAIQQYITSPLRPSFSEGELINVEEEAFHMFHEKWWNFLPEVMSIRKHDTIAFKDNESMFNLSDETFLNLPMITTSSQVVTLDEIEKWKEFNTL